MARGFKIADAYVEITVDKDELRRAVSDIPRDAGPDLDRSGTDMGRRLGKSMGDESNRQGRGVGDKLSAGISMSIVRNSPLIVAAVGGALALGAPAMLTAATGLFAGIGIVAAVQSEKVKSAWLGTWDQVKAGTISAASSIEPVMVRVAGSVGAAFERMQPQLTTAFSAAAPQIEVFAKGITNLAENALPGMVRAVEAGMPVTKGFADFLAKIGTGLSDFFDRISSHSLAAGAVWSQLGDVMGKLLPLLGELLGQGVELAATVLPMLSGGLGLVLKAVTSMNGVLPVLLGYFSAMKSISLVGGIMESLGASLTKLGAQAIPGVSAAAGKMGGALSSAGSAAAAGGPVVAALAATVGLLMAAHQQSEERIRNWANALSQGGAVAAQARQEMAAQDAQIRQATSGWDGFVMGVQRFLPAGGAAGVALGEMAGESDKAKAAAQQLWAQMSPLERATQLVETRTQALIKAIELYKAGSPEAARAAAALTSAQKAQEAATSDLETAIHGVTKAMLDQANAALAAVDSQFAYQDATYRVTDAQNALKDAQDHLNDTNKDTRTTTDDVARAQTALGEALSSQAAAAGRAAADASGLTDKMELQKVSAAGTLAELYKLRDQYGSALPASLQTAITKMEESGVKLDWLGDKRPTPVVDANIDPLTGKTQASNTMLDGLGSKRPTPVANLNTNPLEVAQRKSQDMLAGFAALRPTPVAQMNQGPFSAVFNAAMGSIATLAGQRPNPVAYLSVSGAAQADAAINYAARNRSSTIFVYNRQMGAALAGGGNIGDAVRRFDVGGSPSRRSDGRLSGPGGPLDDLIPAITNTGEAIRVANEEWIIPGSVANRQGQARMAALTSGQADIVPRGAGGGSGSTYNVSVSLTGFDIRDRSEVRRFGRELRQVLIDLDREQS